MADRGRPSSDAGSLFVLRSIENTLGNENCNSGSFYASDPPSSLPRKKRPPMLQIPAVAQEKHPAPDSRSPQSAAAAAAGISAAGPGWGVFSRKGRRKNSLEDFYTAMPSPQAHPRCKGFFGVYDGHGGRSAGKYVTKKLHENVLKMLANREGADGGGASKEEAIRAGFLKTDQKFLEKKLGSGSCCVTAVIQDELAISNVGDCRAVLSRGGVAEALTNDHKGSRPDEKARIEAKGGFMVCKQGIWRVQGDLAITRSFGDAHLKEWGVSAEPDTVVLPVTPEMDFLILASDGLWDKVSNQEAVDTVTQFRLLNPHQHKQGEMMKKRKWEELEQVGLLASDVFVDENQAPPPLCLKREQGSKDEECGACEESDASSSSSHLTKDELLGLETAIIGSSSDMLEVTKEATNKDHGNSPAESKAITCGGDKSNSSNGDEISHPSWTGEIKMDNEQVQSQVYAVEDDGLPGDCTTSSSPSVIKQSSFPSNAMKVTKEEEELSDPNPDKEHTTSCSFGTSKMSRVNETSSSQGILNGQYKPCAKEIPWYADENARHPSSKKLKLANGGGVTGGGGEGGGTPRKDRELHRRCGNPKSLWAAASEKLAGEALEKGSNDDITVMIIDLKHYQ